jgi:hypothetical protein
MRAGETNAIRIDQVTSTTKKEATEGKYVGDVEMSFANDCLALVRRRPPAAANPSFATIAGSLRLSYSSRWRTAKDIG